MTVQGALTDCGTATWGRPAAPVVARRRGGRVTRFLSYVVVLVVLSGCGMCEVLADYGEPVGLRPADLVGTWHGDTGQEITFADDGTFAAADLPFDVFDSLTPDGFDPERDRIDASGSWRLETPNDDPAGPTSSVLLKFGRVAGTDVDRTRTADALGRDGKMERLCFMYYSGCYSFTRAE